MEDMENLNLEQLNQRRTQLRDTLMRFQGNAEAAKEQLQAVKAEAKEKYGTDDIIKLQELHAMWVIENADALKKYEEDLQSLSQKIKAIQQEVS
jgi:archaellum component FlaC